jgi:hypothetical protein
LNAKKHTQPGDVRRSYILTLQQSASGSDQTLRSSDSDELRGDFGQISDRYLRSQRILPCRAPILFVLR